MPQQALISVNGQILQDSVPFSGRDAPFVIAAALLSGVLPASIESFQDPVDVRTLVQACWKADPEQRPSAQNLYDQISPLVRLAAFTPAKLSFFSTNHGYLRYHHRPRRTINRHARNRELRPQTII